MRRLGSRWTLPGIALLAVVALVAAVAITRNADSEGAQPGSAETLEQRNEGGGIEVSATLVTADHAASIKLLQVSALDLDQLAAVHLSLDTHSGDLRKYDFINGAKLAGGNGIARAPSNWIVTADDGHHLEGLLVFDRPQGPGEVRLVLRDLGGVAERAFRWEGSTE